MDMVHKPVKTQFYRQQFPILHGVVNNLVRVMIFLRFFLLFFDVFLFSSPGQFSLLFATCWG